MPTIPTDSDRNLNSVKSRTGHAVQPTRKQQQRAYMRQLDKIRLAITAAFARRDIDEVLRLNADFSHVMRCSLER